VLAFFVRLLMVLEKYMLTIEQKSQLNDIVKQCYIQAEQRLNKRFPRPAVLFNQRGKIAGCALLQQNTLKFHPTLYLQNKEHFLTNVVPHEIAHLLVWQLFGKTAPHGKEWKHMMVSVFDLPPHRTHQYNVDNIGLKSTLYFCECGDIPLTIRRHNKVLKGAIYRCRTCLQDLKLKHS
jgi:SprT protein